MSADLSKDTGQPPFEEPHLIVQVAGGNWEHLNADRWRLTEDSRLIIFERAYPEGEQMVAVYPVEQIRSIRNSAPATWRYWPNAIPREPVYQP